ncbi:hypothetical protein [Novosphingobium sp. B1]|uniref:hypothetical protein n=1 Tax=Novosphingobium sp. B1 TaxID=1938756 RepID=UPI0009D81D79|nr:hypothetical protein [Novosphingobium sp. B1]SMC97042.1 hypothetical protein SAMN06272759_1157 [Novosphingobium sp. B1]
MNKQVRLNLSTVVNASKIRSEKRNGRDVIIVPSATLPDNIVMNGSGGSILYPKDEIEKSYKGLERTPAPLGHPTVNGKFVSARDPEGLTQGWIGAWNENVRRENGRVLLDKVIDVEVANQSAGGKAVLAAIEKQQPIHTSTGILMMLEVANAADHQFIARDMIFDHDAILLTTPGAATPEQGVGMFVNAAGDEIEVINNTLDDAIEQEVTWAAESILRAVERKEQKPLLEQLKSFMMRIIQGDPMPDTTGGVSLNSEHEEMDKAQFDALLAKVDALAAAGPGLTEEKVVEIVGNALKPVTDALAAQAKSDADKAKSDADKAEADRLALVSQVVEAGLLEQAVANEASTPVLNALLAKPKAAFRVNGAYKPSTDKKPAFIAPAAE